MTKRTKEYQLKKAPFEVRLDRLAEVAVKVGLRPLPGQQVIMTTPLESLPLARLIAKHAYQAGASIVTPLVTDDAMTLARYKYGSAGSFDVATDWLWHGFAKGLQDGAARLAISGSNPSLLAEQDADHVSRAEKSNRAAYKPVSELITSSHINWSICSAATPEWAKQVFPDLRPACALRRLWDAIFAASRADQDDPIAAWDAHNRALHARRDVMNAKRFAALRFLGPETDLIVGLADDHEWNGGAGTTKNGVTFNANIPTEEIFTTPHRLRVNGYVSSTKPLSLAGNLVEGIRVSFENGRITSVKAKAGEELLKNLVESDEGSHFLGEVALVPHSSPISKSNILFFNTLFDENAACHIAIGQSYAKCIRGGKQMSKEQLAERGANASNVHTDFMIGSGKVDLFGITATGESELLMRKGEWL